MPSIYISKTLSHAWVNGSILSGSVRKCLFILFSRSKLCLTFMCNTIWMMYYRPNDFCFYKEMLVLPHLLVKWIINHFIKRSCTLWMTHVIERENWHLFSRAVLSKEARKDAPPQNNLDEKIITVRKGNQTNK